MLVTVDCSDLGRTGSVLDGLPAPDLNIDHHQTNLNFAAINLVIAEASATALVLAERAKLGIGGGFRARRSACWLVFWAIPSGFRTSGTVQNAAGCCGSYG